MRPQETVISLRKLNGWRALVIASMASMVLVLAIELLYHPKGSLQTILEFVEVGGILVLFVDLAVNFSRADNKARFLRQNWFELMLFVPFVFLFEMVRIYAIFETAGIQAMPFMMRTRLLVKGGHVVAHVGRSEPARIARMAVVGMVTVPDRYRCMRYRGLLSF